MHNPLRALRHATSLRLNNVGFREFCHSGEEALQKLSVASGELNLPKELRPFVLGHDGTPERGDLSKSDGLILEISSLRRISCRGIALQQNFLLEKFVTPNALQEWFENLTKNARAAPRGSWVSIDPGPSVATPIRKLARDISMTIESGDGVQKQLAHLILRSPIPVMVVGHFNVPRQDGRKVPDRVILNQCLHDFCAEVGVPYVEPAEAIELAGQTRALRDMNHWNYEFEAEAGAFFYNRLLRWGLLSDRANRAHPHHS